MAGRGLHVDEIKEAENSPKNEESALVIYEPPLPGIHLDVFTNDDSSMGKNERLLDAVKEGNDIEVQSLLDQGADTETKSKSGETALGLACRMNKLSVAQILLSGNANVRAKDSRNREPLFSALFGSGDIYMVRLLISHNAPVNSKTSRRQTAMMLCADKAPIMRILLENGATVNDQDQDDYTPLQYAVLFGKRETVELLCEYGANVNIPDVRGFTPLHNVWQSGEKAEREAVTRILLEHGAESLASSWDNQTPLHKASRNGSATAVRLLLEYKAEVNARDLRDWSALHHAAFKGHWEVVQLLLEKGAEAGMKTSVAERNALSQAIRAPRNSTEDRESRKAAIRSLAEKTDIGGKKLALSQVDNKEDLETLTEIEDANSHEKSELRAMKLRWFAARPEYHGEVREMLEGHYIDISERPISALQWAAYHGNHEIAWWILKTDPPNKNTDHDRIRAKKIAELRRNMVHSPESMNDKVIHDIAARAKHGTVRRSILIPNLGRKTGGGKGKCEVHLQKVNFARDVTQNQRQAEHEKEDKYSLTLDMLRDPPLVVGNPELDESYKRPSMTTVSKDEINGFDATIVDFYSQHGRVKFFRRSRKVYNVIYDDNAGVEKIMDQARATIEKISPEAAKEQEYPREDLRLRWIHLPANNLEWMQDLAKRLFLDRQRAKEDYLRLSDFVRKSWQELPSGIASAKFMKPACSKVSEKVASEGTDMYQRVALYMPYITFGRCFPKHVLVDPKRKYEKLLRAYREKLIHESRSLDQFYYHTLSNMTERDHDQVITRYLMGERSEQEVEDPEGWTILKVDQLWLWIVDQETIITSSTHRPDGLEDPVLERIFNYLREERGKGKGQPPPSSVHEMSKFIVSFCIDFINQANWNLDTSERSAYQIFADTINRKAVEEASLTKAFTEKMRNKREESNSVKAIRKKKLKDSWGTEDWKSISQAAELLEEVKDIRDELNILRTLLTQQKAVWQGLIDTPARVKDEKDPTDMISQINEMDNTAKAIQVSVNGLLGLEQNSINITEAILSREQAEESIRQGRTLMVFTIVTIIFLPLSFFASLFALNVSVFQHDGHGNLAYQSGWIFPIIFCISAGITVPLIITAFYFEDMTRILKRLFGKGAPTTVGNPSDETHGPKPNSIENRATDDTRNGQVSESRVEEVDPEAARATSRDDETASVDSDGRNGGFLTRLRHSRPVKDPGAAVGERNV